MNDYIEDPNHFPDHAQLIDDSDAPNAGNFNPCEEAQLDRTAYLAKRLLPQGKTIFNDVVTTPAGLAPKTGMAPLDTVNIPGYGYYIYQPAATNYADGTYVVTSVSGGRWLVLDYGQTYMRVLAQSSLFGTGFVLNVAAVTKNAPDPLNRGTGPGGFELLVTPSTFDFRAGDLVQISWTVPFYVNHNSGADSDLVVYAGFKFPAPTWQFFDPLGDSSASTTGVQPHGITWCNGVSTAFARTTMSRSVMYTMQDSSFAGTKISLVAAYDLAAGGLIAQQGTSLVVTHYRTVL